MSDSDPFAAPKVEPPDEEHHAVQQAPRLMSVNGVGTILITGNERADGTRIGVVCISVFFIPTFPLSLYVVKKVSAGTHQFLSRIRKKPTFLLAQLGSIVAWGTLVIVLKKLGVLSF